MPVNLREYMSDNLRSNYTGGFIEYNFDKSVDWVQTNVSLNKNCFITTHYRFKIALKYFQDRLKNSKNECKLIFNQNLKKS